MASKPLAPRQPWRYTARQAAWAFVDLIFPPLCGGCGTVGQRFCQTCRATVVSLPPLVCQQCGYPLGPNETSPCRGCRQLGRPALVASRSVAFFEGPLQNALHRLKYKRDVSLADSLALHLAEAWPGLGFPADLVVPVPLSAKRLRERGYNQAALLAQGFADLAGLTYYPHALARTRHANTQVGLSAQARRVNVLGAFTANPRYARGRAVALIDDVCTTGATLEACAEALREAGATQVWGFTLARARRSEALPRAVAEPARQHLNN